jgi:tetratricopeptide (TPR) repeat protein
LQALDTWQNSKSPASLLKPLLRAIPKVRNDDLRLQTQINTRIAQLYIIEAKFDKAQTYIDAATRSAEELYAVASKEHPQNSADTAWVINRKVNYAEFITASGEIARAKGDYRQCRALCEKANGILDSLHVEKNSNVDDAISENLQAEAQEELDSGRYQEAEKLSESALRRSVGTHGWYSPITFAGANNLADVYVVEQRYNRAVSLINKFLCHEMASMNGHPTHCRTTVLNALCWSEIRHGKQPVAPQFEWAIQHDTATFGENHPALAEDYNGYAAYKLAAADPSSASALLTKSLAILQTAYGTAHPQTVSTLNDLAGVELSEEGDDKLKEADQYAQSALDICGKYNLQLTPEWERAMNDVGIIAMRKHDDTEAEAIFKRLSDAQLSGAPVNGSLLCGLKNYAAILRHNGKDDEASQLDARVKQAEASTHEDFGHYRQIGYLVMPDAS